jgi:quaternary ammonium compound-resistance protein SugE
MAWALLGIAGLLEIAFAFAMKSSEGFTRLVPALFTVGAGLSSVVLLSLSMRTLPMGTGYAVWTGIGAAGTAIVGVLVLGDSRCGCCASRSWRASSRRAEGQRETQRAVAGVEQHVRRRALAAAR